MKKYKFKIRNLDCANCANELENTLKKLDMVENVSISFMMQRLSFECIEENREKVVESIKNVIKKEEPDVVIEEI